MVNSMNVRTVSKAFSLILAAFYLSITFATDPLEPYLARTTYLDQSSTLSSGCAYVKSNIPGLMEVLSIDFKLDGGVLGISGFKEKDRRPLTGCSDSLEVNFDTQGQLTTALYTTNNLKISGGDSTVYNLSAEFSEFRKPLAQSGQYLFDAITYSVRNCASITENAVPVSPQAYFTKVVSMLEKIEEDVKTPYIDNPSDSPTTKTVYGPVSHLFYMAALDYARSAYVTEFEDFIPEGSDDVALTWEKYQTYRGALCDVFLQKDSKGALYSKATILTNKGLGWSAHVSKWKEFEYIDTGRKVIAAPSPAGLEYYTKYTTGGGIIIVSGDKVDDEALLAARDAYIYMTSARPEMRGLLQRNHTRLSLFVENASELPEYGPDMAGEVGGFAQGSTDANMTGNATWLCYEGNWVAGGNPAIHELGHVINHLVFEETNEVYWYNRIAKLANEAREKGTMPASSPLGEYWAQAVEGYIMNKGEAFKTEFPTREDIAQKHSGLYELLTRYLPTELWDFCPGYEQNK
jgi:hypothetical protein